MVDIVGFPRTLTIPVDPRVYAVEQPDGTFIHMIYQASPYAHTIENRFQLPGEEEKIQKAIVITRSTSIDVLRVFVNITSLEVCPPVEQKIEDSEFTFLQKVNDNDANFPAYEMRVLLYYLDSVNTVAVVRLQNKRPGYYINLLRFLTDRDTFEMQIDMQLRFTFKDIGHGYPTLNDTITTYLTVTEYGHLIPPPSTPSTALSITLPEVINLNIVGSPTPTPTPTPTPEPTPTPTQTPTPEPSITIMFEAASGLPESLMVYHLLEPADLTQPIDLAGNMHSEVIVFAATSLVIPYSGIGYYFICPRTNEYADSGFFFPGVQVLSSSISPFGSASFENKQVLDSAWGITTPSSLPVLHLIEDSIVLLLVGIR